MRTLLRRLGYLLRRRQIDADLAEELEMHRSMVQERLERSGMAPDAAASASARTLGNVTLAREDARAVLVWPWLESIGQDLRIGMRWLLQRPAFTAVAVMTLRARDRREHGGVQPPRRVHLQAAARVQSRGAGLPVRTCGPGPR